MYGVPPIILYENGHSVCDIRMQKIPHCPICRQQFLSTGNVALEKLAIEMKYPCPHRKYGCKDFFVHDTFREHQHRCHYHPQTCPVSNLSNVQCSWTGLYHNIKTHLIQQHRGVCCEYIEGKFTTMMTLFTGIFVPKFVFALNEVFCLTFQTNYVTLYAVLQYVGPSDNAAKYKYKVEFINTDNTDSVTVMHLTKSFDEKLGEIIKSGNCGKVQYDVVRRLVTKGGRLKFTTEIFRVAK